MKERPILFQGEMVRAILMGVKTQTRRIVTAPDHCQPALLRADKTSWIDGAAGGADGVAGWIFENSKEPRYLTKLGCPHGEPGDRLWVKETFQIVDWFSDHWEPATEQARTAFRKYRATDDIGECQWKPSIFMPRWASRITLEITGIRVQRLQEISYADALAEGVFAEKPEFMDAPMSAVDAYCQLWEKINGKGSWARKPWVWVIEFKKV